MVEKSPSLGHSPAADTVLKEDSRGARLAKQHKDPKRIDAAVAAVMATTGPPFGRRPRPSIYL